MSRRKLTLWSYHSNSSPGNGAFAGVNILSFCVIRTAPNIAQDTSYRTYLRSFPISPVYFPIHPFKPALRNSTHIILHLQPARHPTSANETFSISVPLRTHSSKSLTLELGAFVPFSRFWLRLRLRLAWRLAIRPVSVFDPVCTHDKYPLQLQYVYKLQSMPLPAVLPVFVQ